MVDRGGTTPRLGLTFAAAALALALVARKAPAADRVDAAWGILKLPESVDAFVDRARG